MTTQNQTKNTLRTVLTVASVVLFLGLLFARFIFPELLWLTAVLGVGLIAALVALFVQYRSAMNARATAFGAYSAITVALVVAIIGVLNFLGSRYPLKLDLTKNKQHTLSEQTVKLVKGLKSPVKATLYAKLAQREQTRPLLENYKALNAKFEIEYIDPDREPTRAKQSGIKKYGTLQLTIGTKDSKIEEVTEEKLTNALIKLTKEKTPTLCTLIGHGERNLTGQDADGYSTVKKGLADQSYETKDVNPLQEGKIPPICDALAILGPNKAFFDAERKLLREYLENGGRALIALDLDLKGGETAPEIVAMLQAWHVRPAPSLIVDPVSRMFQLDASFAILASFSGEHAITREFKPPFTAIFPFSRPLEIIPGSPAGMNVQWLAQSTPQSVGISDLKDLAKGRVTFVEGRDKKGPLTSAVAVEGKLKDSKAPRSTRLVVFGSSHFATNNYSRFAGNLDFFLNAVSWIMEDESLISIRPKEDGPGKLELSEKQANLVKLVTVFVAPFLVALSGLVIWIRRRRL